MNGKDATSRSLMNALNRVERLVMMLFYAEELSTKEIALVLEMSEKAVATILLRLRTLVRETMMNGRPVALA